jgi:CBS domain-containing protein
MSSEANSTVQDLMSSPVVQARPDESLGAVVRRMDRHRVGSVVITRDGAVSGIVTERDVLRHQAAEGDPDAAARTVMSAPADCLRLGTPLTQALVTMRERGYRHMPVVDGEDHLLGMVSLRDLARAATIGPAEVPRGLKGVVVTDTEIGPGRLQAQHVPLGDDAGNPPGVGDHDRAHAVAVHGPHHLTQGGIRRRLHHRGAHEVGNGPGGGVDSGHVPQPPPRPQRAQR